MPPERPGTVGGLGRWNSDRWGQTIVSRWWLYEHVVLEVIAKNVYSFSLCCELSESTGLPPKHAQTGTRGRDAHTNSYSVFFQLYLCFIMFRRAGQSLAASGMQSASYSTRCLELTVQQVVGHFPTRQLEKAMSTPSRTCSSTRIPKSSAKVSPERQ